MADEVAELRREVCALHAELPRHGLVTWTSGNLSARVPGEELMVIKASGIPYPELLDRLIQLGLERHAEKQGIRTSYTPETAE